MFQCDQCSYQTRIDHLYQLHVAKHSLDRPFQCPDCGLQDLAHSSFVNHLMDHQQTKILKCCFCEYKSNIFGMRLHMAKHRAVEPFDCSFCEFSSYHLASLKTHVDRLHTKRFSCNYCKKVMTKYLLIKHTDVVHGVNIRDGQGEPLIAIKSVRRTTEDPSNVDGAENMTDVKQLGDAINAEDVFLNLSKSRIVLKRLDLESLETDKVCGPVGNTPKVFQDSPQIPEPDTSDMTDFKQMIPAAGDDDTLLPDPNSLYAAGLPEPLSPKAVSATILPEPKSPKTVSGTNLPESQSPTPDTDPTPREPLINAGTGTGLPEPMTCDNDDRLIIPEPESPEPDTGRISLPMTSGTFMIMPQPMSPDHEDFQPDSMIYIEEEIDVKPDLDALVNMAPSKPKIRKTMYHCNSCEFSTARKFLLRQHAPKHLLDSNFVCAECEFKEPSPYIFAKHLASRRTKDTKLIHCCFCDQTYRGVKSMCTHLGKHKPVKLDDCPKCGVVFQSKQNFRDHYNAMHVQKWECQECGKWMSKYSLRKHRLTHVFENSKLRVSSHHASSNPKEMKNVVSAIPSKPVYKCDSCNYHTRVKSLLRRHVSKHLLSGAVLVCSFCKFTEKSARNFAIHLKDHSTEGSHNCCFCEYSTPEVRNLIGHLEIHRTIHFFDCSKCDKSYSHHGSLSTHYRTYHVDKHQCTECGKVMCLSKVQRHKKVHSTGNVSNSASTAYRNGEGDVSQPLYTCNFCRYSTDIESLYTNHIAKHSMDEAYFVCTICQHRDQDAWKFSGHLRSHSNDLLACCFCDYTSSKQLCLCAHLAIHRSVHFYDCYKCEKSFKGRGSLFQHNRSYHIEKHACIDCGEVITYHELLQHKKLHAISADNSLVMIPGQEPFYDPAMFNCYHCSYATKVKSLLRRHAVKHLIDSRLVCPDCDFKDNHARDFAKHCVSRHGGLNCCFCSFATNDLSSLAGHLEIHRQVLLYDCTECPYSSNVLSTLKTHYKKMHVAKYKCSQCDEVMSRFEHKLHRLKHAISSKIQAESDGPSIISVRVCEPGSLLCGYCDYSTNIQSLMEQHVAKHEIESDIVCPKCGFSCRNSVDFATHLGTHQTDKDIRECCFCDFATFYKKNLSDHIERHRNVHLYDCPKCDTTCSNKSDLKAHYEKYHVIEHVCTSCDAVVTYEKLLLHEEMHAQQVDPTYYCDNCPYKTKKKSLIRLHVSKHVDAQFVCPKCQYRESNADLFVVHLETCSVGTACCFCSYSTTEPLILSQHLEIRHRASNFFDCSKCDKSFSASSKLMEHNRQRHKDKHRCSVCGAVMTYFRLLQHMKLHKESGVSVIESRLSNRFRCNHCIFTTKKKSLLRKHAPKHLVDNRLSCTICKFKTNIAWNFVKHLQAHNDDDVINCCFCDYSSINKHKFARHVDLHRPVHFNDCWKCDKSYSGGGNNLQQHFYKYHVQKHTCWKDKCYLRMTLYRLQKHQAQKHKTVAKEIPYYVCRGPIKKKEELTAVPMTSTSSMVVEVQPDVDLIREYNESG